MLKKKFPFLSCHVPCLRLKKTRCFTRKIAGYWIKLPTNKTLENRTRAALVFEQKRKTVKNEKTLLQRNSLKKLLCMERKNQTKINFLSLKILLQNIFLLHISPEVHNIFWSHLFLVASEFLSLGAWYAKALKGNFEIINIYLIKFVLKFSTTRNWFDPFVRGSKLINACVRFEKSFFSVQSLKTLNENWVYQYCYLMTSFGKAVLNVPLTRFFPCENWHIFPLI